jgi:hypothetical protein
MILNLLKKTRKDIQGNLIFRVGDLEVCTPAFLRILGVTADVEESKAPGQWLRLIKGYKEGLEEESLLSKQDLKLDKKKSQYKINAEGNYLYPCSYQIQFRYPSCRSLRKVKHKHPPSSLSPCKRYVA